ncbi:MAG: vitamin K epoxide reductase family protein [Candidatus Uhrbacteria bacterium]|nr:vitamin K epoxide reductase family protein [Candidatus Uhrbacteria bacterium]
MRKWLIGAILIFSIFGGTASVYAALAHFDLGDSSFCSINETFDCEVVNKSSYSEFLGIPVSLMGFGAYIFLFISTIIYIFRNEESAITAMTVFAIVGLFFSLYLTFIEALVLYTWCLLCLASQLSILVIAVSLFRLRHIDHIKPKLEIIHD